MINFFKLNKNKNIPSYSYILLYSILGTIYFYYAINSTGYDDEFWNIGILENTSWGNIINLFFFNCFDVHPPLSYFADRLLFDLFKNWNHVRAFLAIILILSSLNLTLYIRNKKSDIHAITFTLIFLCNPAVLMWCTSIRWYTYFIIFFNWLLVIPSQKKIWFHTKLIVGLLLLSFTGYITIIFIIPIFLYYYKDYLISWKQKLTLFSIDITIFLLLYSFQVFLFLKHHIFSESPFDGNLFFPIKKSILGFATAFLSNQGIMPFSMLGIISILSTTILLIFSLRYLITSKNISNEFIPLLTSLILLFLSGASGYLRIFITLTPFQSIWLSSFNIRKKKYLLPITLIIISQIYGIQNVLSYSGTTKLYFNVPVRKVLKEIDIFANECESNPIVFHHLPALSYQLKKRDFISISHIEIDGLDAYINSKYTSVNSPYQETNQNDFKKILNSKSQKCLVVVDNFRGFNNFPSEIKREMLKAVENIKYSSKETSYIGLNKDILFSRIIDPDFPSNKVKIYKFKNPRNLKDMKIWFDFQSYK